MATIGFSFTSLALVLALIPAPDNEHPVLFLVKVLLGSAALVGVGIGQFVYSRKSAAP